MLYQLYEVIHSGLFILESETLQRSILTVMGQTVTRLCFNSLHIHILKYRAVANRQNPMGEVSYHDYRAKRRASTHDGPECPHERESLKIPQERSRF